MAKKQNPLQYVLALVFGGCLASIMMLMDWPRVICKIEPTKVTQLWNGPKHVAVDVPSIWARAHGQFKSSTLVASSPQSSTVVPLPQMAPETDSKLDFSVWSTEKMKYCLKQAALSKKVDVCATHPTVRPDTGSTCRGEKSCKLMIVAHADDETLFGGKLLMEKSGWTVVCVTCNEQKRWKNFQKVMKVVGGTAVKFGLPDIHYEPWPQKEQQLFSKGMYNVMKNTEFTEIVTHNSYGEYGHPQHQQVFQWVAGFIKDIPLYVFNANVTVTVPLEQREFYFKMLACHTDQVRALSKLVAASFHQSVRLCIQKFSKTEQMYFCANSNKQMEEEEMRILRPANVVSRFHSRSNFLRNANN